MRREFNSDNLRPISPTGRSIVREVAEAGIRHADAEFRKAARAGDMERAAKYQEKAARMRMMWEAYRRDNGVF